MIERNYLTRWLMQEEGLVLGGARRDSLGQLTMGYGHKCETFAEEVLSYHMNRRDAENILGYGAASDVAKAIRGFEGLFKGQEIDPARTVALIALVFQLGEHGVRKFRRMRQAIAAETWGKAKMELLFEDPVGNPEVHSRYHTQTPARAKRVAAILETGRLPEIGKSNSAFYGRP